MFDWDLYTPFLPYSFILKSVSTSEEEIQKVPFCKQNLNVAVLENQPANYAYNCSNLVLLVESNGLSRCSTRAVLVFIPFFLERNTNLCYVTFSSCDVTNIVKCSLNITRNGMHSNPVNISFHCCYCIPKASHSKVLKFR